MKIMVPHQLQTFISQIGLSLPDLLQEAELPDLAWQETLELSPLAYHHFLQVVDQHITDDQILQLADVKNVQLFLPPVFAALSASNGQQAIDRLTTYKQLIGPVTATVTTTDDEVQVSYQFVYPEIRQTRLAVLIEQLLLINLLRTGTGQPLTPTLIQAPVAYGDQIRAYCDCPIEVADQNSIRFSVRNLAIPFKTENNLMWQYLAPTLRAQLDQLTQADPLVTELQQRLLKEIPSGTFDIATVSAHLGVSERTLQRKLAQKHTSFNAELRQTQQLLAKTYLRDFQLTTADIAYLVGYTEVSSFSRAFSRWTGQSLTQYRQQLTKT